ASSRRPSGWILRRHSRDEASDQTPMAESTLNEVARDDDGRAGGQILLTLLGGVLLVVAAVAYAVFPEVESAAVDGPGTAVASRNFYGSLIAIIAALTLGAPLVYRAFKDLWEGRTQMNALA